MTATTTEQLDQRHLRARAEWNHRVETSEKKANNYRKIAFLSCVVTLVAIVAGSAAAVYALRMPPGGLLVLEIDKIGRTVLHENVGERVDAFTPSDQQIQFHLNAFVEYVRAVPIDRRVLRENWNRAALLCSDLCEPALERFAKGEGDAQKRVEKETVQVRILSSVRSVGDTWQVDWRETTWDLEGKNEREVQWRGMFTTVIQPSEDPKIVRLNPLGLYITQFHWNRVDQ
jgi:type IV secretion system protein VirB5